MATGSRLLCWAFASALPAPHTRVLGSLRAPLSEFCVACAVWLLGQLGQLQGTQDRLLSHTVLCAALETLQPEPEVPEDRDHRVRCFRALAALSRVMRAFSGVF